MNVSQSNEPSRILRYSAAVGISLFSLLLLFALGGWTWLLRDGLGPDSIESSGVEAVRRFMSDFWPIALFCNFLFAIAFFLARGQSSARLSSHREDGKS